MDPSLQIVSPKSHSIYFDLQGESYSRPICGIVAFRPDKNDNFTTFTQLRVRLVRTIKFNPSPVPTCQSQGLLKCLSLRFTKAKPTEITKSCSTIEETQLPIASLSDNQVNCPSTDGQDVRIPFTISIPVDIPGSVTTSLGEISYDLIASMITGDETIANARQSIYLDRQVISPKPTIEHARSYPNSKVVTQICLSQHLHTKSESDLSFSMNIKLRSPSVPGERPSEFKCTMIRGIRFRVEEVTRIFAKSDDTNHSIEGHNQEGQQVNVREICNGREKSHWVKIIENPVEMHQNNRPINSSVDVMFGCTISKNIKPAQRTDLACYAFEPAQLDPGSLNGGLSENFVSNTRENLVMTVEHRLKLDLLTGEDTFERGTLVLVDRKPVRVALNASFPLLVSGCNDKDIGPAALERYPPRYEEVPIAPPGYDRFVESSLSVS
ncbi:hypothetical protein N7466_000064 [Penicillium verhagenii]|uniref:uncharacterized protein n=1 Tax=Penicillium verhagenii TaxID=1562060 RepID=UPI0025451819|nr:uncharacterized protein N7466_000064 [Penicillium verhagenii]KAJ5947049.1 hypothetical protein N7466_000064 [Penicillium verhagenii]